MFSFLLCASVAKNSGTPVREFAPADTPRQTIIREADLFTDKAPKASVTVNAKGHDELKIIRFEGEMLPHWARLLDVAANLSQTPDETRKWFARFTSSSGLDKARTVISQCTQLRKGLETNKDAVA